MRLTQTATTEATLAMVRKCLVAFTLLLLMTPASASAQNAKWTVMVFMNADNNLEGDGILDFLEMSYANYSNNVNIVVQMDRCPGESPEYGDWTQTLRFKMQRGIIPTPNNAVMDIGEANMGDPAVLKNFIDWGKQNYPAEKYALVIWDHGDGWRFKNISSGIVSADMKQKLLADYKKQIAAADMLKNECVASQANTFNAQLAELTQTKKDLTEHLNNTSEKITSFPVALKKKYAATADFYAVYDTFNGFTKTSLEKIPAKEFAYVNLYANTIDSLTDVNFQIKTIEAEKHTKNASPAATDETYLAQLLIGDMEAGPVKAVSHDGTNNDILYNREIQDILIPKALNVIGFDACLMSMLETSYALKDKAEYLVGSEELEPGTGWNYMLILTDLANNPDMKPIDLTKSIVEAYRKTYRYASSVTLSSIDLGVVGTLCSKLDEMSRAMINNLNTERPNIAWCRDNCLKYAPRHSSVQSIDLSLFAQHLSNKAANNDLKSLCAQIKILVNIMVVDNFHSDDRGFSTISPSWGSLGLAIYFPNSRDLLDNAYNDANTVYPVAFVNDFSWDNFLAAYLK